MKMTSSGVKTDSTALDGLADFARVDSAREVDEALVGVEREEVCVVLQSLHVQEPVLVDHDFGSVVLGQLHRDFLFANRVGEHFHAASSVLVDDFLDVADAFFLVTNTCAGKLKMGSQ